MYKMYLILILSFLQTTINAQSNSDATLAFAAVIVSDMDRSLEWYTERMGFQVVNQVENADRGFKQANLTNTNTRIELIELSSALSPGDALSGHPGKSRMAGLFKIGFDVGDLDKWIVLLDVDSEQVVKDPVTGARMCIVRDPDGNRVQLFEK